MHVARVVRFANPLSQSAALIAAVVALGSCNDRGPVAPGLDAPSLSRDKKVPVVSVADTSMMVRTPSAPRGARGGTTLQLDVIVMRKNGKQKDTDKHITWLSSDTVKATVDSSGLVTAQDTGTVIILADYKDGSSADSVAVDIVPVPVVTVTVAGPDSISIDDTVRFLATPRDSVGEPLKGRTIVFASSAPAVATMSAEGDAIALSAGTTEISATVETAVGVHALRVWPQPVATVSVDPVEVNVPQYHKVRFTAVARDRRGKVLIGRATAWRSSDPAIFYVTASGDTAAGRDLGSAVITATVDGMTGSSGVTVTNPVEARALWVTRFEYTTSSAVDFAKIATIMAKAASANFNVVYFQARTSGDALYFSDIEPCSPRMCGKLGGARPALDPLDVALGEAAKYGIEVHAWLNAYTGFISGSTTACGQFIASTPSNWLKAHPEWSVSTKSFTTGVLTRQVDNCSTSSEYMWISPGVPEVRTQLARVASDIVRRYGPKGLKGIHLDRIRFPSNQVTYDAASQEAFKAATGSYPASNAQATWLDFRRGFVNQGVKEVSDSVQRIDPSQVLSAAVFPAYKPKAGWSAQWSYTDLFQDPQAWAQGGYLDVEVPMNYPATSTSASWTVKAYCSNTDWSCVLDDHIARIEVDAKRQVYVGVGAIKGWDEMKKQIDVAHDRTATGMSVYSFSQVDAIANGWAQLAAGPFRYKAAIPAMEWKGSR